MARKKLKPKNILLVLVVLFISFHDANVFEKDIQNVQSAYDLEGNSEKIFVVHAPVKNLDDFREVVKQAARLKPYARVEMNVSILADKGFQEIQNIDAIQNEATNTMFISFRSSYDRGYEHPDAPEKAFLQNMVQALKIHRSIFRSLGNFVEAQEIRDRNTETLAISSVLRTCPTH